MFYTCDANTKNYTNSYNCHHMRELLLKDRNPEIFTEAYLYPDKPVDWDKAYEGFDAAVDWYVNAWGISMC